MGFKERRMARTTLHATTTYFLACLALSTWGRSPLTLAATRQVITLTYLAELNPLSSDDCPASCDLIFEKLGQGVHGKSEGRDVQHVEVQIRGEPKSGTTFMYEWGTGALSRTCLYLQNAYGKESCVMEARDGNRTLLFEPALAAGGEAPCSCTTVERATISLVRLEKHMLPVAPECGLKHIDSIATETGAICTPPSGKVPTNQIELWNCVKAAGCRIMDDRPQMVVMRDPRPVVVSAYFHLLHYFPEAVKFDSVDEFVVAHLPAMTKWISVRYLLFHELPLPERSQLYWYDESLVHPIHWHEKFLSSAGLQIPERVVAEQAGRAAEGGRMFGFPAKGIDPHAKGKDGGAERRSFKDELSATTLMEMDDVLRTWLPPAVLERLNV